MNALSALAAMIGWLGLAALSLQVSAAPHTWSGVVTLVVDGDTVHVRAAPNAEPRSVRIQGIDAPESCQPHGPAARQALKDMALGRTVSVATSRQDDYGRDLAVLHSGSEDLGQRMVSAGHAWSYRSKKEPGPYAAQERLARRDQRGLFSDPAPEYPGQFRRRHGRCVWGPAPR